MLSEPDNEHEASVEGFTASRRWTDGCWLSLVWQTETAKVKSRV